MVTDFFIDPGFHATGVVLYSPDMSQFRHLGCHRLDELAYKVIKKGMGTGIADSVALEALIKHIEKLRMAIAPHPHATRLFLELPGGSQSNRASRTLGLVYGALVGWAKANHLKVFPYTAFEVKRAMTGNTKATKEEMIDAVTAHWPKNVWVPYGADLEHIADAAALIVTAQKRGEL